MSDLDETDRMIQCRDAIARTLNLGFVVDTESASRIGDMYGVDGALVTLDMTMQLMHDEEVRA